jgi:hypothetical protein
MQILLKDNIFIPGAMLEFPRESNTSYVVTSIYKIEERDSLLVLNTIDSDGDECIIELIDMMYSIHSKDRMLRFWLENSSYDAVLYSSEIYYDSIVKINGHEVNYNDLVNWSE